MSSKAACARVAIACASPRNSTIPRPAAIIWAEHYDRDLVDVFAVQDEITDAIVTAIEPQIYAAENFRSRRKPPSSVDAWDLVMRALSHHWRVTQKDSAAAQALLEQAIEIDPNYGQALALLATNHMFGVHLGWADIATAARGRARGAGRRRADSEDAWAHTALGSVYFSTRRLDHALAEFETGVAAKSELLAGSGLLRAGAVLQRTLAGRLCGRATAPSARARAILLRDLSMVLPPTPSSSAGTILKRCPCARSDPPARRPERRLPGADGRRRHGRDRSMSRKPHSKNCGGPNPISR